MLQGDYEGTLKSPSIRSGRCLCVTTEIAGYMDLSMTNGHESLALRVLRYLDVSDTQHCVKPVSVSSTHQARHSAVVYPGPL